MPGIPAFDDFVVWLLQLLGVPATIIALVGAAFAIQSWLALRKAVPIVLDHGGRALGSFSDAMRQFGGTLAGMRPVKILLTFTFNAVVLLAQTLTIIMCFLAGNFIALAFDHKRWRTLAEPANEEPLLLMDLDAVGEILVLDRFSGTYVALAAVAIIASHWLAWRGDPDGTGSVGALLALPAWILVVVAGPLLLLGLALNLLAWPITQDAGPVVFLLELAAVTILVPLGFGVACTMATRASALLVRTWRVGR